MNYANLTVPELLSRLETDSSARQYVADNAHELVKASHDDYMQELTEAYDRGREDGHEDCRKDLQERFGIVIRELHREAADGFRRDLSALYSYIGGDNKRLDRCPKCKSVDCSGKCAK